MQNRQKSNSMKKRVFVILLAIISLTASGQCRYCNTYEDFVKGQWVQLDTVYCNSHSKTHQFWWGGNDFTLTTRNNATDKILKKKAFVVMQADRLYVNCRNLQYDKMRFGNGYTRAKRIGQRSLLLVNKMLDSDALSRQRAMGIMFGAIGGLAASAVSASAQMKQQVCYVISWGGDKNGRISIRLIDDTLMEQMLVNHNKLRYEYYSEEDAAKRILASHIIPILEKAGLFHQFESSH